MTHRKPRIIRNTRITGTQTTEWSLKKTQILWEKSQRFKHIIHYVPLQHLKQDCCHKLLSLYDVLNVWQGSEYAFETHIWNDWLQTEQIYGAYGAIS